jgi:hypothetical protein
VLAVQVPRQYLKASYTSSLRPHTLVPRLMSCVTAPTAVAQGLMQYLKALYTSSLRPHTLVARLLSCVTAPATSVWGLKLLVLEALRYCMRP